MIVDGKVEPRFVSIPETEYLELMQAKRFLTFLESFGVDSWDGYEEALKEFNNRDILTGMKIED